MKFFSRWFIVRNKWPQFLHQVRRSYYITLSSYSLYRSIFNPPFYPTNTISSFFLRVYFSRVKPSPYFLSPNNDGTCSLFALQSIDPFLLSERVSSRARANHFHTIKRSCRAKVKHLRVPFLNSNFEYFRIFPLFYRFIIFFFYLKFLDISLFRPHFPFVYRFYPTMDTKNPNTNTLCVTSDDRYILLERVSNRDRISFDRR